MDELQLHEASRSLEEIITSIPDKQRASVLKSGEEFGWITNGIILYALSNKEKKQCKERLGTQEIHPSDVRKLLPKTFGSKLSLLDSTPRQTRFPYRPPLVWLCTKSNDIMCLPTWAYALVIERWPECIFHQSSWWRSEEEMAIAVVKKTIVAAIMPLNIYGRVNLIRAKML